MKLSLMNASSLLLGAKMVAQEEFTVDLNKPLVFEVETHEHFLVFFFFFSYVVMYNHAD